MRENENGNGQDWNACPIRLGCMPNRMNEKESGSWMETAMNFKED